MSALTPLERAIAEKTDRKARYVAKQRASGLVRVALWVPAESVEDLRAYAAALKARQA